MSATNTRKTNNSWSLKSCLKAVAAIAILSHTTVVNACSPTTLEVKWEQVYVEVCKGRVCSSKVSMEMAYSFTIRGGYSKSFYATSWNKMTLDGIGKHCSPDGVYCVKANDMTNIDFYYANTVKKYTKYNARDGSPQVGRTEYWDCM
ncbi:hypothetical protein BGW38_002418 [Lunasporangiospora selenospora]|uniref:Peptidase inhibitor family I36 n=1 Tax=Lunasporangiospora selenospora TaxID=979761 RepID=A0A9P6KHZ5_9FUNG|nr:hypothetical protein BGW38_002418 [Lunasporangiospora selenospora]